MSKKILIVDDSAMMRLALNTSLTKAGYTVIQANDGNEALGMLKDDLGKIDLIVCDVNMPNMDGLSFVKAYKTIPEYQYIPVLMLTSEGSEDRKAQGRAAGVRAWMMKPFEQEVLMSAISKLIN